MEFGLKPNYEFNIFEGNIEKAAHDIGQIYFPTMTWTEISLARFDGGVQIYCNDFSNNITQTSSKVINF